MPEKSVYRPSQSHRDRQRHRSKEDQTEESKQREVGSESGRTWSPQGVAALQTSTLLYPYLKNKKRVVSWYEFSSCMTHQYDSSLLKVEGVPPAVSWYECLVVYDCCICVIAILLSTTCAVLRVHLRVCACARVLARACARVHACVLLKQ